MSRQIFFDVTELSKFDKGTGIQRVTRAILLYLINNPPVSWTVVPVWGDGLAGLYRHASGYEKRLAGRYVPSISNDPSVQFAEGDIFITTDLAYNINGALVSVLDAAREQKVGIFCVVYDLIPARYPQWFEGTNAWFEGNEYLGLFDFWLRSFARVSDGLIGISLSVERDVERWLGEHRIPVPERPKLGFFHMGCDIASSFPTSGLPDTASSQLARFKSSPTFLMVGTIEPRKGYALALQAFERLWSVELDVNLVFVGRKGWKVDDLSEKIWRHKEFGKRLFWFEGISDEYLRQVYLSSTALLSLSLAEGFGLPNVEAASFGLPVIARDIEVFREICAQGTTFIGAELSAEELETAVVEWLKRYRAGEVLLPDPSEVRTWAQSTRQLMSVIDSMGGYFFQWRI